MGFILMKFKLRNSVTVFQNDTGVGAGEGKLQNAKCWFQ